MTKELNIQTGEKVSSTNSPTQKNENRLLSHATIKKLTQNGSKI